LILYLQNQSIHISAETLLTFLERAEATARRRAGVEAGKKAMMDDVSYKASSSEAELE
jgi:hypothetical protein